MYLVTMPCMEHRKFLQPTSPEIGEALGFLFALAVEEHGLKVHAMVAMSTHYHAVVTDTDGRLPAFKELFHGLTARVINAERGRFNEFWARKGSCDEVLLSDEDVVRCIVYTLANPTLDGLVKWGHRWPGLTTYRMKYGEKRTFRKPEWFFDRSNKELPDEVELTLVRPRIHEELSDEDLHELVMSRVREREQEKQDEMRRAHRRFPGEVKVAKPSWDEPAKAEQTRERFTQMPTVSASDTAERIAYLKKDQLWRAEYARCREALINGDYEVVFPYGTYWLRVRYGVKTANAPP